MWSLFGFDLFIALILLYLPGYFILRAFNLSNLRSLAFAPVLSSLFLYLFSFAYVKLNIVTSSWVVILPVFLVSLVVFVISRAVFKRSDKNWLQKKSVNTKEDWLYAFLYVGIAAAIGLYVFVETLDGAASFSQQYDNYTHLSLVRQFLDTGLYAQSSFLGYPSAWHNLVALVANIGQQQVTVATNAVNYAISSVVFPFAMFSFMSLIFGRCKTIMVCGAICSVAFTAYPWGLLAFGPLYPNLLGYAVLPSVMAIFILVFSEPSLKRKIGYLGLFVIGCIALLLMHPNVIFSGMVLLAPFVFTWILGYRINEEQVTSSRRKRILFAAGFLVVFCAIWVLCYKSPLMGSVTVFNWPAYLTGFEAIANCFVLIWTKYGLPQYLLAFFVAIGFVVCVVKRKHLWIAISYLIVIFMLVVAESTEGQLKHVLTGFWYTDSFRIAAMATIAAIPLASVGFAGCFKVISVVISKFDLTHLEKRCLGFLLLLFVGVLIFLPNMKVSTNTYIETPFGHTREILSEHATLSETAVYEESEVEFVAKAKDIVGDALVLNIPFDGSFLSYGVNGINTAYRDLETPKYWREGVDQDGKLLRKSLDEYESRPEIKQALLETGAQYVLLLDSEDTQGARMFNCSKDLSSWEGIMDVSEETAGFELVLSDGDMKLYRITG